MKKHIKRLLLYIPLAIILVFLVVWGASLIKCEILTDKYYDELEYAHIENTMIGKINSFKVLECDGETAEVYYVCDNNTVGNVLKYQKENGKWKEIRWDCIWSKQGSADEMIWPYWWHTYSINTKSDVYEPNLEAVLNSRLCFINESGEAVYLKNFSYDYNGEHLAEPTRYAYVDLDSDSTNELVVDIAAGDAYIVLYSDNVSVYGYLFYSRELQNIKYDGTFTQSSGADNIYYCEMSFNENNYIINNLASSNNGKYEIDGEFSRIWEFNDYTEKQNNKKDVEWISIS